MEKKFAAFRAADDFILDEYFQEWVYHPDLEKDRFWNRFFEKYPEKKVLADQARVFLSSIDFPSELAGPEKEEIWSVIEGHTRQTGPRTDLRDRTVSAEIPGRRRTRGARYWIRAAAAVSLLIICSVVLYDNFYNKTVYRTAYGEITTITLPDSSLVTLNANSELHTRKNFSGGKVRELWLEGEAFFDVRPVSRGNERVKFIVHTVDLDVSVLGTEFNVYERKAGTEVVLQSGKVGLDLHADRSTAGRGETHLLMRPGDLVSYNKAEPGYEKRRIETGERLSWVNKKLLMDDTPFSEVLSVLREIYGEKVIVSDPTILEEEISGELPLTNKDIFLEALSTTMRLTITKDKENSALVIERK